MLTPALLVMMLTASAGASAEAQCIVTIERQDLETKLSQQENGDPVLYYGMVRIYPIPGDDQTYVTVASAGPTSPCNALSTCVVQSSDELYELQDGQGNHVEVYNARLLIETTGGCTSEPEYNLPWYDVKVIEF